MEKRVSNSGDERQPFTMDPTLVERGLRGHADIQNALAQRLREAGLVPRSRLPHEPNFDLAWRTGERCRWLRSKPSPTPMKKNSYALASARFSATGAGSCTSGTPSNRRARSGEHQQTTQGSSLAATSASSCSAATL